MHERVLLLLPSTSYKAADFLEAAERLAVEVVVGSDHRQALADEVPGNTLDLDPTDADRAVARIVEAATRLRPVELEDRTVQAIDCLVRAEAGP